MALVRQAFTLIELLVVLAIIAVMAGILFPVFSTAKSSAYRVTCLSNFRQVGTSQSIYNQDYDDMFVLVNHQPASQPNSRNDRTWVQLLLPYVKSFRVFQCPGDFSNRPTPEATFDQDLVPGDLYSQYYTASMRSNLGYNFEYLAPIYSLNGEWTAWPKSTTSIPSPSSTIAYIDSAWSVVNGQPVGGGSWIVAPPCRYEVVSGVKVDTFQPSISSVTGAHLSSPVEVFQPVKGWDPDQTNTPYVYGGAWPWHSGRVNVSKVDGSAASLTLDQLTQGCDVQPHWTGSIFAPSEYRWYSH